MQSTKFYVPNVIYACTRGDFVHTEHIISDTQSLTLRDLNSLLLSAFFLKRFNARIYLIQFPARLNLVLCPVLNKLDLFCAALCKQHSISDDISSLDSLYNFFLVAHYHNCSSSYYCTFLIICKNLNTYYIGPAKLANFSRFLPFVSMQASLHDYWIGSSKPRDAARSDQLSLF